MNSRKNRIKERECKCMVKDIPVLRVGNIPSRNSEKKEKIDKNINKKIKK